MKKFMKKTEGFTLVELIVVIAILGILAGVGTVGYSGYIKKANEAADNQLLATVNHAFATACIENGVDASTTTAKGIDLSEDKAITAADIQVSKPAEKADAIGASFAKYFAGNESSAFKLYTYLRYRNGVFEGKMVDVSVDEATGAMTYTFEDGSSYTVTKEQVQAIKNSTYGENMTMDQLLGEVTGMVDAMGSALGGGSMVAGFLTSDGSDLEDWGVTAEVGTEEYKAQLSNAAVLYVAKNMTAGTTEAIATGLQNGDIGGLLSGSQDTMLINAAGIYGIVTGFAHSDEAKDWTTVVDGKTYNATEYYDYVNGKIATVAGSTTMNQTEKMQAMVLALGEMGAYLYSDPNNPTGGLTDEFASYAQGESSKLGKDADGLANAMTAINTNSGSLITSGAIANGFGSGDISDILNVIMGG